MPSVASRDTTQRGAPEMAEAAPAEIRFDLLEWLPSDCSAQVFRHLNHPADVVRASVVSRSWYRFVIANNFIKNMCHGMCPDVSKFSRVVEVNPLITQVRYGGFELESHEIEHRVYACLISFLVLSGNGSSFNLRCIGASSTDRYPDEGIQNTLDPRELVADRWSYWCSGGEEDPNVPESLTYRLNSDLCLISEIKIRPFKVYFQHGDPIYSSRFVRIRMGYSKLSRDLEYYISDEDQRKLVADDNYVWTFVSQEFPMSQKNVLQSFKLEHPVLCIGGVVKIDLLGRVQRQQVDNLFYIGICHVEVIGRPLAPVLAVDFLDPAGSCVLKYSAMVRTLTVDSSSRTQVRPRQHRHFSFFSLGWQSGSYR